MELAISQRAFDQLQRLFKEASGIQLGPDKRNLVQARLRSRLEALQLESYEQYCDYLRSDVTGAERQHAVDLLTTNETYFFREPGHFEQLGREASERFRGRPIRIWSAACSTGEEPYSIAMTLIDKRPDRSWSIVASDLSTRVLERAREGMYGMSRLEQLPPAYLKRFCLRGTGSFEGLMRVSDEVQKSVQFCQHNLLHDARGLGTFDIVFIRNVLIYFDDARKRQILERILDRIRPGGLLFLGHAEPIQEQALPLRRAGRSVFERT